MEKNPQEHNEKAFKHGPFKRWITLPYITNSLWYKPERKYRRHPQKEKDSTTSNSRHF